MFQPAAASKCRRSSLRSAISWIEDDQGGRVYKVDGKALRVRDTFVLKDRDGNKVASIQEDTEGRDDLSARGSIVDDEYEVKRDGEVIATVSKKWLRVRDTYGVEIRQGEDEPLLLAPAVALDKMSRN
jgi:uncharacterized protein YxjI